MTLSWDDMTETQKLAHSIKNGTPYAQNSGATAEQIAAAEEYLLTDANPAIEGNQAPGSDPFLPGRPIGVVGEEIESSITEPFPNDPFPEPESAPNAIAGPGSIMDEVSYIRQKQTGGFKSVLNYFENGLLKGMTRPAAERYWYDLLLDSGVENPTDYPFTDEKYQELIDFVDSTYNPQAVEDYYNGLNQGTDDFWSSPTRGDNAQPPGMGTGGTGYQPPPGYTDPVIPPNTQPPATGDGDPFQPPTTGGGGPVTGTGGGIQPPTTGGPTTAPPPVDWGPSFNAPVPPSAPQYDSLQFNPSSPNNDFYTQQLQGLLSQQQQYQDAVKDRNWSTGHLSPPGDPFTPLPTTPPTNGGNQPPTTQPPATQPPATQPPVGPSTPSTPDMNPGFNDGSGYDGTTSGSSGPGGNTGEVGGVPPELQSVGVFDPFMSPTPVPMGVNPQGQVIYSNGLVNPQLQTAAMMRAVG